MKCICTKEWLLSHDIIGLYRQDIPIPHTNECNASMAVAIRELRDNDILNRYKWLTASSDNCDYPYSHSAHGECSGRSFDRT